ncbi:hypothetical protein ACIP1T_21995 [Pseudomonas japonica]|uniref:hypothetical protein n=1 Tax=Pseudomonas japonica TaxID=256466 RepID=UPI0038239E4C
MTGVCGLNGELEYWYADLAQKYSEILQGSVYSFNTSLVASGTRNIDFLLGEVGDVEIYDRYHSARELADAVPEKYIKVGSGCFFLGKTDAFLMFRYVHKLKPTYLELLVSLDPLATKRLEESDLKGLARNECY